MINWNIYSENSIRLFLFPLSRSKSIFSYNTYLQSNNNYRYKLHRMVWIVQEPSQYKKKKKKKNNRRFLYLIDVPNNRLDHLEKCIFNDRWLMSISLPRLPAYCLVVTRIANTTQMVVVYRWLSRSTYESSLRNCRVCETERPASCRTNSISLTAVDDDHQA